MLESYIRARKEGQRQVRHDVAEGRYPYPPALDDILAGQDAPGMVNVGTFDIPLYLIAGTRTHGRQNSFSRGFMPLLEANSEFAAKWSALAASQAEEGFHEPIRVFEYCQRFYVQEGNKRVSVARFIDAPTIAAHVTRVVPMAFDEDGMRMYRAFSAFFRACPIYGITVEDEASYARLARMAGRDLKTPWPDEAVSALRATFAKFRKEFFARGGDRLDIELGDAFLRFLMVCEYADALELTQSEVSSVVERMWGEFKVAASSDAVAYLEDPSNGGPTMARGLAVLAKNAVRPARPLTIAFIYDDDEQYSGWVAEHDRGRRELELRMPGVVRTLAFPECESNAAFAAAVEEAASEDADLVVTVQPTQMTQALRAAIEHPEMSFLNCSLSLEHSAVRTFGCRVYEAKFLLGLVAGSMAENHQVGYIAESPVYGTVSEINAFAAGVAAVDPGAEIHLGWISTCDYNWRADMSAAGVSVVCGRDAKTPADPFGAWGLFRYEADGSTTQLGHPVWNWARYYELIVRSMRNDVWRREGLENPDQALNYWWGMSTGVLDVELTDAVPAGVAVVMGVMREAIMKQKLNPFALVPADMAGEIETSERISPEEIIRMSWLADNVIGRLPRERELKPDSREQVEVAGIISVEIGIEEEPGQPAAEAADVDGVAAEGTVGSSPSSTSASEPSPATAAFAVPASAEDGATAEVSAEKGAGA